MERGELYEQDFLRWTEEQAAALRRARDSNLPLDWDNLAKEIESLGKSQRRELGSQIRRVLLHLLKLEASLVDRPRAGWRATIKAARADIEEVLEESPSLRREVDGLIRKQARIAAELAAADLARHSGAEGPPRALAHARCRAGQKEIRINSLIFLDFSLEKQE